MVANDIYNMLSSRSLKPFEEDELEIISNISESDYIILFNMLTRELDKKNIKGGYLYNLLYACIIFCLNPNKALYNDMLSTSLHINDPSFIQSGAAALLLIKSPGEVALDLVDIANKARTDHIVNQVLSLFYFIGHTAEGLTSHRLKIMFLPFEYQKNIWRNLPSHNAPIISLWEIELKITRLLLDVLNDDIFQLSSENAIFLLTAINLALYPPDFQKEIIQAYFKASSSDNKRIRNSIEIPHIKELMEAYKQGNILSSE